MSKVGRNRQIESVCTAEQKQIRKENEKWECGKVGARLEPFLKGCRKLSNRSVQKYCVQKCDVPGE